MSIAMSFRVVYCFAAFAVMITHNMIFPVEGQSTVPTCEPSPSIVAALEKLEDKMRGETNQTLQEIRTHNEESLQEMKSQFAAIKRSLDAIYRRLEEHDSSATNKSQNSSEPTIGVPAQLEHTFDYGNGSVLLPTVNDDWIVIMSRYSRSLNFNRNWIEYKNGFGQIEPQKDYWLGNEIIHRLTNEIGNVYSLRVEVLTNGTWYYADYATFSLDSEINKYALRVSRFSGTAGDSLTNTTVPSKWYHNGMSFSTSDADNDNSPLNCAEQYSAGWWYNNCWMSCLTCEYGTEFAWESLKHLPSNGRLGAARMMIKRICAYTQESRLSEIGDVPVEIPL